MSHFAAELPPKMLNRIEPGAVGGQIKQDEPPSRSAHDRLHVIIRMGAGIVPGDEDGSRRVFIDQPLQ